MAKRVLLLQALPSDQVGLRLDREYKAVVRRLQALGVHRQCEIALKPAVQANEVLDHLRSERWDCVHFAGHGERGRFFFEDSTGRGRPVTHRSLADAMVLLQHRPAIVFLNSCYSARFARILEERGIRAVGMRGAVSDDAAIEFAAYFYGEWVRGGGVDEAFAWARTQVNLAKGRAVCNPWSLAPSAAVVPLGSLASTRSPDAPGAAVDWEDLVRRLEIKPGTSHRTFDLAADGWVFLGTSSSWLTTWHLDLTALRASDVITTKKSGSPDGRLRFRVIVGDESQPLLERC